MEKRQEGKKSQESEGYGETGAGRRSEREGRIQEGREKRIREAGQGRQEEEEAGYIGGRKQGKERQGRQVKQRREER